MVRELALEGVAFVEGRSDERTRHTLSRERFAEHDMIYVTAVVLSCRAIHEAFTARDVDESRPCRFPIVDLGPEVAKRALVGACGTTNTEVMVEVTEYGESVTRRRLLVYPGFEQRDLLGERFAIAPRIIERASRAACLQVHGEQVGLAAIVGVQHELRSAANPTA